jgi:hypothetical protein
MRLPHPSSVNGSASKATAPKVLSVTPVCQQRIFCLTGTAELKNGVNFIQGRRSIFRSGLGEKSDMNPIIFLQGMT